MIYINKSGNGIYKIVGKYQNKKDAYNALEAFKVDLKHHYYLSNSETSAIEQPKEVIKIKVNKTIYKETKPEDLIQDSFNLFEDYQERNSFELKPAIILNKRENKRAYKKFIKESRH